MAISHCDIHQRTKFIHAIKSEEFHISLVSEQFPIIKEEQETWYSTKIKCLVLFQYLFHWRTSSASIRLCLAHALRNSAAYLIDLRDRSTKLITWKFLSLLDAGMRAEISNSNEADAPHFETENIPCLALITTPLYSSFNIRTWRKFIIRKQFIQYYSLLWCSRF